MGARLNRRTDAPIGWNEGRALFDDAIRRIVGKGFEKGVDNNSCWPRRAVRFAHEPRKEIEESIDTAR